MYELYQNPADNVQIGAFIKALDHTGNWTTGREILSSAGEYLDPLGASQAARELISRGEVEKSPGRGFRWLGPLDRLHALQRVAGKQLTDEEYLNIPVRDTDEDEVDPHEIAAYIPLIKEGKQWRQWEEWDENFRDYWDGDIKGFINETTADFYEAGPHYARKQRGDMTAWARARGLIAGGGRWGAGGQRRPALSLTKYKIGDTVIFGKPNGEQTRAKVTGVGRRKYALVTLEPRGRRGQHRVGGKWYVPESLIQQKVSGSSRQQSSGGDSLIGKKFTYYGERYTIVEVRPRAREPVGAKIKGDSTIYTFTMAQVKRALAK
jgi:hypothetical protein